MKLKEQGNIYGIYGICALLLGTAVASTIKARNFPIEALNFPQPNTEIVSYEIPTTGNVVSIDRDRSEIYPTYNSDGSVTYIGKISYCIRPENNSQDDDYWCDRRPGSVTIRSKGN